MSDDLVAQLRTYFGSPLLPVSHQAALAEQEKM